MATQKNLWFVLLILYVLSSYSYGAPDPDMVISFSDPYTRLDQYVFFDQFSVSLRPANWPNTVGTPVNDNLAIDEPTPPYSLHLKANYEVQSRIFDINEVNSTILSYLWQRSSTESGDNLQVDYWNGSSWVALKTHYWDSNSTGIFYSQILSIPSDGRIANARIRFRAVCGDTSDHWFIDNVKIQVPASLNEPNVTTYDIYTLRNESQATGITLTNCSDTDKTVLISMAGLEPSRFDYELRRQIFCSAYYYDGLMLADPLSLLTQYIDETWEVIVPKKDRVKLYLSIRTKGNVEGIQNATINIKTGIYSSNLTLRINVLDAQFPTAQLFDFHTFCFPADFIANISKDYDAENQSQNGVVRTGMPTMPITTFNADGSIYSIDYTSPDTIMFKYAHHVGQFMLFWESKYDKFTKTDGNTIPKYSTTWDIAFKNVLDAWLTHTKTNGYGSEYFAFLPIDEARPYTGAGEDEVNDFIHVSNLVKEVDPNLPIMLTLSDYVLINDVNIMLPYVDIIMPVWPYRTFTLPNQPTNYNPRASYYSTILPRLKQWRTAGKKIYNYHISPGKCESVIANNRAYPVLSYIDGTNGQTTYGYNAWIGDSWSENDGSIDYSFMYDGYDADALDRGDNPTLELVVPSIRWKSICAGQQDATILAYLANVKSSCDSATQIDINSLINEAKDMAADVNAQNEDQIVYYRGIITPTKMYNFSKHLRTTYTAVNPQHSRPTAMYNFDDNGSDVAPNSGQSHGNHLTENTSGMFNSGEYVHMIDTTLTAEANDPNINSFHKAFTISFWMKAINAGYSSTGFQLARKWGSGTRSYYLSFINYPGTGVPTTRFSVLLSDNGTDSSGHTESAIAEYDVNKLINGWNHVVLTFDGDTPSGEKNLLLYVTPAEANCLYPPLIEKESAINSVYNSPEAFKIAGLRSDLDGYLMYDRALSKEEIEELFYAGRKLSGVCPPIALYTFNKDGNDLLTVNNNNLTPSTTSGMFVDGNCVKMIDTSLTAANNNPNINSLLKTFTISFWMKAYNAGYSSTGFQLARKWGSGTRSYYLSFINYPGTGVPTTRFSLLLSDDGSSNTGHCDNLVAGYDVNNLTNGWKHVAVTFDGSRRSGINNIFLYVTPDGNTALGTPLIATHATVNSVYESPEAFKIAGLRSYIDGYTIYDRALSKSELTALLTSGRHIQGKLEGQGPYSFYKLDADANDFSGNSRNLEPNVPGMLSINDDAHVVNDFIIAEANDPNINSFTKAFTISFWIKDVTEANDLTPWELARKWGLNTRSYYLSYSPITQKFGILLSDDGSTSGAHSNSFYEYFDSAPMLNKWYHVAATFDGDVPAGHENVFLYVTPVDATNLADPLICDEASAVDFVYKSPAVFRTGGYTAHIDGYTMANRALSKKELEQLFDAGRTLKQISPYILRK
ncbi:MAG: hypothetical protein A2Y12_02395 [Planctomycetes bacterium GWF2_42_9]|nr:MAG: hypothetical protein A2Y12_02395 [Planctomycetes bacterium GWF2_42_9]